MDYSDYVRKLCIPHPRKYGYQCRRKGRPEIAVRRVRLIEFDPMSMEVFGSSLCVGYTGTIAVYVVYASKRTDPLTLRYYELDRSLNIQYYYEGEAVPGGQEREYVLYNCYSRAVTGLSALWVSPSPDGEDFALYALAARYMYKLKVPEDVAAVVPYGKAPNISSWVGTTDYAVPALTNKGHGVLLASTFFNSVYKFVPMPGAGAYINTVYTTWLFSRMLTLHEYGGAPAYTLYDPRGTASEPYTVVEGPVPVGPPEAGEAVRLGWTETYERQYFYITSKYQVVHDQYAVGLDRSGIRVYRARTEPLGPGEYRGDAALWVNDTTGQDDYVTKWAVYADSNPAVSAGWVYNPHPHHIGHDFELRRVVFFNDLCDPPCVPARWSELVAVDILALI